MEGNPFEWILCLSIIVSLSYNVMYKLFTQSNLYELKLTYSHLYMIIIEVCLANLALINHYRAEPLNAACLLVIALSFTLSLLFGTSLTPSHARILLFIHYLYYYDVFYDEISMLLLVLCSINVVLHGSGEYPELNIDQYLDEKNSAIKNVVILAIGTRGDIQPFISLGLKLEKEYSYSISICAYSKFKDLIESYDLKFYDCGVHSLDVDNDESIISATHAGQVIESDMKRFMAQYDICGEGFYKACTSVDPVDLILCTTVTSSFGLSIAEKLNTLCIVVKFAPDVPTRDFAPPGTHDSPYGIVNLVNWYIYWVKVALSASRVKFGETENNFRAKYLQLPALDLESFVRKPVDWGSNNVITGFWFTVEDKRDRRQRLDKRVSSFLGIHHDPQEKPICLNFGSMSAPAEFFHVPEKILYAINQFAADAGRTIKVLLIREAVETSPPDYLTKFQQAKSSYVELLCVDEAPHELVFPHCKCVIHHGGAGTTARVIQCNACNIIIPIMLWTDQSLWAQRLHALRVAVYVDRQDTKFENKLLSHVEELFNPEAEFIDFERLRRLSNILLHENGVDAAAKVIHHYVLRKK